jgi:hypothetical protein
MIRSYQYASTPSRVIGALVHESQLLRTRLGECRNRGDLELTVAYQFAIDKICYFASSHGD